MNGFITNVMGGFGSHSEMLLIGGVAVGCLMLVYGLSSAVMTPNPAATRLQASDKRRQARHDQGLLKPTESDPSGLMKSFVPTDKKSRGELQKMLSQAGYGGQNSVAKFMLIRVVLSLGLPGLFMAAVILGRSYPMSVVSNLGDLSNLAMFQSLTALLALGYFGPLYYLRSRVAERRMRIQEGFPNALDLLQISLEAGLGFDAAMTRVGNEIRQVTPDIAFEFLSVQHEVQAGRGRDEALDDMAKRIGLDVIFSFANVVRQSMQFGTSMTEALAVYSEELREFRETRAQEQANKLPVKMSAVLALLMLPALILLALGPIIIRYTYVFGG